MSAEVDLSVIAPCFNEQDNVEELVDRLNTMFARRALRGEVVLVNDASTDGTGGVLRDLAERVRNLVVCTHPSNRGIEAAWKTGLKAARGAHVCFIDADLQNPPEDVWRLYQELLFSRVDLIQGTRSTLVRERDSRYFLSRGLNVLLNLLFGMRSTDNKSGFILGRKEILEDVMRHRFTYRHYQTFIGVAAHLRGYSLREVETLFEKRLAGSSFMSRFPLAVVTGVFADLAKALVEFRVVRKRENVIGDFVDEQRVEAPRSKVEVWRRALFGVFCATMPVHKWQIRRSARWYYEELRRSQWLTAEQVRELQERKMRALVSHAYYHVPFYRELLDGAGVGPTDIATLEDLRRIPLLSKDTVRENLYHGLLSNNHDKRRILRVATSGSTGEPFVCYADRHQLEIRWAATLRGLEMTGYRFGDRQVRLWHQTIGMSRVQATQEKLDAFLSRRVFIPAFEISDANAERVLESIRRYKPVLLDGYAESLHLLASHLGERSLRECGVKAIVTSAQSLPVESRRVIEGAFGCKVFDKYGSREFSGIAWECEAHEGHHVVGESYIVEVLKEGRPALPGEVGEVVITDLNNYCMPFIRYRIGDLAVAIDGRASCPCGRGLPRIGNIEGRVQSIIIGGNGCYLPGTFFAHFFKEYTFLVRQYQVVQDKPGAITLRLVKGQRFSDQLLEEMLAALRQYVGASTDIVVESVDLVPLGRTGKRQAVISSVPLDYQDISVAG
jgi:phenylacetate-CoA ligase